MINALNNQPSVYYGKYFIENSLFMLELHESMLSSRQFLQLFTVGGKFMEDTETREVLKSKQYGTSIACHKSLYLLYIH